MYPQLPHEALEILADFLTNMAAGWFATVLIFPGIWNQFELSQVLFQLFFNLLSGIMALVIAIWLKREVHNERKHP